MDFTFNIYKTFLKTLSAQGFSFDREMITDSKPYNANRTVFLRQDVDRLINNSLQIARIQKEREVASMFYFRVVKESWDERVVEEIAGMGHEIGYHYEDVSLMADSMGHGAWGKGKKIQEEDLIERSAESFERNLEKFRKIVPVKSICMHGSPMSRWDSRLLWKYYDYRDFGIDNEPYFDGSFEDRLYLTDTGRRWNGSSVSVRDKAWSQGQGAWSTSSANASEGGGRTSSELQTPNSEPFSDWVRKPIPGSLMNMTPKAMEFQERYNFRHTRDIIEAIEKGQFPEKVMMTFHPQRWTNKPFPWIKELIWQNTKNLGKYFLIKLR